MSDTITDQPYTHHAFVNSSAIDEVFYDADTQKLFLYLLNGGTPAYRDVPLSVFEKLADPRTSAGRYWNHDIKPCYQGINGNVRLVRREDLDDQKAQEAALQAFVDAAAKNVSGVTAAVNMHDAFTSRTTYKFVVGVEVQAESVEQALRLVAPLGLRVVSVN